MPHPWLDELNAAQRRAATHPEGPLLVIAGAGTGKTKTLAARVAWLIGEGVPAERILLLTFTRRAAAEMLRRAAMVTGEAEARKVWGGTFHAMSNRLLRRHGRALGLQPDFTVMDQADAADLMNLIRGELRLGEKGRRFPKKETLVAIYSRAVNSETKLSEVLDKQFPWCRDDLPGIRQIFEQYGRRKRQQNVLDYDDLLLYWRALCQNPSVGPAVSGLFEHVLVDEYQDTNRIQAAVLRGMRAGNPNVMVVGDDAQSIYSFRSANVRNILDFPEQFPGTAIVKLEKNYRSTQPILDACNAVMAEAQEQYAKELVSARGPGGEKPCIVTCLDEDEQARAVCEAVLNTYESGTPLREQAVLFRAAYHSAQLELELSRRNIPFVKYGGLKFVEAAHVKDLLALLRVVENPWDELSWYRMLQLLPGVGPKTAGDLMAAVGVRRGEAEERAAPADGSPLLAFIQAERLRVPPAAAEEMALLREALAACARGTAAGTEDEDSLIPPAAQIAALRRFYDPACQRLHDDASARLRDLDQLEQIAARYRTRRQLITEMALDPPASTQDLAGPPTLEEDYLILSTIHSAKGGEWDGVYVIHVADGMIPSDMATGSQEEIAEERRLLYVAMTRARNFLGLYFPLRYYSRGPRSDFHSYAQLTRFIPPSAYPLFERSGLELPQEDDGGPSQGHSTAIDQALESLWE
jgi:DNA helicase II / ATP-dependent DNA helicase PcrA